MKECLARAVGMVVDRLKYLSTPPESHNGNSALVSVRPLKTYQSARSMPAKCVTSEPTSCAQSSVDEGATDAGGAATPG